MAEIKIDKGVPAPAISAQGRPVQYPWHEMQPGDSIFVPGRTVHQLGGTIATPRRIPGTKWTARTATENGVRGVRIWRVA